MAHLLSEKSQWHSFVAAFLGGYVVFGKYNKVNEQVSIYFLNTLHAGQFFMFFFCRLLIFSKSMFLKNSFRNTNRVSNILDPDQAGHFVGPDLGPNCLQGLSADDTSRQNSSC